MVHKKHRLGIVSKCIYQRAYTGLTACQPQVCFFVKLPKLPLLIRERSTALERPVNNCVQRGSYIHELQISYLNIYLFDHNYWLGITCPYGLNIPGYRDLLINEEKAFCERQCLYKKNKITLTFIKKTRLSFNTSPVPP